MANGRPIIWAPQPGPQTALLLCPIDDVFFGGARGGGKSDGLLGDWLMHLNSNKEHARGLFFRKTYPELSEVWSRAMEIFPHTGADANKSEMTFTWQAGARLEFRYLENDDDAARYQGKSVSWEAFDELGNFTSFGPIDKLYAILRSAHGARCVRRSAGNPGGPLTQQIRERYIDPAPPLVPFKWAPNKARPDLQIESVFIPSRLEHNQILLKNDPGYEVRLAGSTDPMLYRAWRYGDWTGLYGRFFLNFDENSERCVEQPTTLSPWFTRWIAWDWGFSHDSAITWGCYDGSTIHVYRELAVKEMTPQEIARTIVQMTGRDERIECVFLSPDAGNRRGSPRTIEQEIREALPWPVKKADNDRIGGWVLLNSLFQRGGLKISSDCKKLIKWLSGAQRDTKRPEDVLKHDGDDLGDSLRYLVKTSEITPRIPDEVIFDQRIKPLVDKGNYFGAMVERFKIEDELHKGNQPVRLRGKRRR